MKDQRAKEVAGSGEFRGALPSGGGFRGSP